MDGGWTQSGPDSDAVFNGVYEEVTLRARRRKSRVIREDWLGLVESISHQRRVPAREVSDALAALLDLGWIEKVDEGFRVLEGKNPQELSANAGAACPQRGKLSRSDGLASSPSGASEASEAPPSTEASEASRTPGFKAESAQNAVEYLPQPKYPHSRRVVLARNTFPSLCREAGIQVHPMQFSWTRLAQGIGEWQTKYGIDLDFVRQMMYEFVQHPEWCHRSRRTPDRVFVSRREELAGLVTLRQRQQRSNPDRKGWSQEDWLRRSDSSPTILTNWMARP